MDRLNELIQKLTELLKELTEVEKRKLEAVRGRKVLDVEECIKSEQVYTMRFRACEKKLSDILADESYEGMTLRVIIDKLPAESREKTETLWEKLKDALTDFHDVKDAADDLLRIELYRMNKALQETADRKDSASESGRQRFHARKA